MAALPRWSPEQLSTRQSSWASAEFMVLFRCGAPDVIVQQVLVQIWKVWGQLIHLSEAGTVCLQPVLHDAQMLRNGGCLG